MDIEKTTNIKPKGFKAHLFTKEYESKYSEEQIWKWLNNPNTFIKSQVWPFKVEFLRSADQAHDFVTGVLNNHHGPGLSLAGKIGEITPHYRDLEYFYGSYALSFRLVRPFRLEFWTDDKGDKRIVRVQLSCFVHNGFFNIWSWSQNIFWKRFGKKMNQGIKKLLK
ncbi:hypothetical protein [Marivirga harenae]|uniref:hypothetical protein n=1 Tax=Marivirga harenae TaxID=2010992 RepID=UPI0026DEE657|nr:hypothetical protein [Marivirga harenae]WKV11537.1 hypothetical protein Q3Y49_15140 [Marivirga harenae]|tara:strand:- start:20587 stop:21084 length:498 start_codon:yes stop_codon:yes gene_type:complete